MGHFVNIDQTRIAAYFLSSGGTVTWHAATDLSTCYCTPVTVGKRYALAFSETDSSVVGRIFRFGFTDTNTPTGQVISRPMLGSPQSVSFAPFVPDKPYLIIQLGGSYAAAVVANYLTLYEYSDSETEEGMGGLMLRRPGIVLMGEWDYNWHYTSGDFPSESGLTKTITGTASEVWQNGYMIMRAAGSNNNIRYTYPRLFKKAVLEIGCRQTTTAACTRIYLGDGESSIGVRVNYSSTAANRGIFLHDAKAVVDMTKLMSFATATTYYIRLVLDNGVGQVWVRNATAGETEFTLLADNVDCSTIVGNAEHGTSIRFVALASGTQNLNTYAIRMKLGRLT